VASPELVFAGSPAVIGGGRILPSPSSFYVTGEDNLRIVSVNAVVGVSLKLQWRLADSRGVAVPNSVDHTPNTDRTLRHEEYTLGVGQLLNVTVFASAGSPNIGQTYVLVQLVRGSGSAAIVLGTLLGGYVTTTQALGFPGSPIVSSTSAEPAVRLINGTTPPAGVDFSEQCPTGARWQLLSLAAKLQTSAVAATRSPAVMVRARHVGWCNVYSGVDGRGHGNLAALLGERIGIGRHIGILHRAHRDWRAAASNGRRLLSKRRHRHAGGRSMVRRRLLRSGVA
jgi:hypothetical protein